MYNCTKLHTGSAVPRVTKDRAARPHLPSTVENQLERRSRRRRRRKRRRQLLTTGQWNVRDTHSTRAMRGANCWTDHQTLRSKVAFRIRQKYNRQGTSKPTKLNTAKLSTISHRDSFEKEMDSVLAQREEKESSTPDDEWTSLQQVVYNTAKTYLGKPERKHQDWFDPNDQELQTLMSRRDQAHQRVLQTRSTISTTAACLQTDTKTHPCTEVRLVGKEGSGAAGSC